MLVFQKDQKQIIDSVKEEYLFQVLNLDIPNTKFLVCFAGIPCSGKSRVASDLESELIGVKIASDPISNILYRDYKGQSGATTEAVENLKGEILMAVLDEIKSGPNGLVILDKGIERTYIQTKKWAMVNKFPIFIIKVTADKEDAQKCYAQKDSQTDGYFSRQKSRWEKEFTDFEEGFNFDFEINTSRDYRKQLSELVSKIKS